MYFHTFVSLIVEVKPLIVLATTFQHNLLSGNFKTCHIWHVCVLFLGICEQVTDKKSQFILAMMENNDLKTTKEIFHLFDDLHNSLRFWWHSRWLQLGLKSYRSNNTKVVGSFRDPCITNVHWNSYLIVHHSVNADCMCVKSSKRQRWLVKNNLNPVHHQSISLFTAMKWALKLCRRKNVGRKFWNKQAGEKTSYVLTLDAPNFH